MKTLSTLFGAFFLIVSSNSHALPIEDHVGRFEINYSTGRVRFFGVSVPQSSDNQTWRPAEQRAWSDGLSHAEAGLAAALAAHAGPVAISDLRLSKFGTSTISVNTTYFGDNKIKVQLEAPIVAAVVQLLPPGDARALEAGTVPGSSGLVLKAKRGTVPTLFFTIVDESGRELVRGKDIMASVHAGAPLPKWYQGKLAPDESELIGDNPSELRVNSSSTGVLKVNSSSWSQDFAKHIGSGRVAVIVE